MKPRNPCDTELGHHTTERTLHRPEAPVAPCGWIGWRRPFLVLHQAGIEMNLAVAKANPEFHASCQQFLFDLPGHAWLLSPTVSWSVGICVNRVRAELMRRAAEAKAISDAVVQRTQSLLNGDGAP